MRSASQGKKMKGTQITTNQKPKEETKMNQFKRVGALVVTVAMTLALMVPMVSASTLPTDVAGTKYEESVQLLQALKIMVGDKDTGAFRLEDSITRSEFSKMAVKAAGLDDVAQSSNEKSSFPDVVKDHWATGYINVAASQKFIIGDDVGTFRPDDKVTFAEAATILVRVLGFEPSAKANGGFPTGYLVVAGQNNLLKGGVSAGTNEPATRGMVAMMTFNSLTTDLMERTGYGSEEQYEVVDKTLLADKLDVSKVFGQVVANSESTLTGASSLREDEVQIKVDNVIDTYKVAGTDAKNFLARNVVAYVQESDTTSDKNLVLVANDSNKNTSITVAASDIQDLTGVVNGPQTLSYWINKATDRTPTKATISSTAKIFYNGVATAYNISDIKNLQSGKVTILDTERSDNYGYVFVTEYKNLIVDDVSLTSFRVNDKYNMLSLTLDPDDKNIKFTITKNGETVGLETINEWDVLSVAMDTPNVIDAKVINVLVSTEKVTGKVVELEEGKVRIGEKLYEIASNYTEANRPEIKLEDEGTFYLDVDGKIAAVDTLTRAGSNYAYLVDAEMTGSIDNKLEFQLFNKAGETVIIKGADKIKVNSVSGLNGTEAKAAILAANGGNVAQLITYEVNSAGDIYYVNTAAANNTGSALKNIFSMDYKSDVNGIAYSSTAKKLGSFNVNASTIVLDIPAGETDPENFAIRNMSMFVDKSNYNVEVYDLTEDMTASLIIVKDSQGQTNAESPIALVDRITDTQNAEQTAVQKLYAIENGVTIDKLSKDSTTLVRADGTKLQPGDIIQYTTNARGEIDKVTVLFDGRNKDNAAAEVYTMVAGTEMETILGKVTRKFATSINVTSGNMTETNFDITNAKVYNYDFTKTVGSQVSVVDASQIQKYDSADARKVFIRIFKGEVKEIVIIKEN